MARHCIRVVVLLGILLASPFTYVTPATAMDAPVSDKTVTGAAIPLPPKAEQQYLDLLSNYTDTFPVSPKTHVFLVMTKQKTWVVATDEQPQAGIATVEGTAITSGEGDSSLGVLFASDVSISTDGQSAKLKDVRKDPSKYGFELVEITANYRQIPYTVEVSDKLKSKQAELGVLTTGQFLGWKPFDPTTRFGTPPGKIGRWATLNLSSQKLGGERLNDLGLRLSSTGKSLYVYGGSQQFAMNGTVTVSALVLTRPVGVSGFPVPSDGPLLYLVDSNPKSTSIPDVSTINARGSELEDSVVTVDAQVVGARTSSKEFLLSVAKCAPESVTVPVTPPGCVPVVTDSIVHTGVLYSQKPTSNSDFVGFVGLSNHRQQKVTKPIRGSYRITGRVVPSSKVSSSLPEGYVVVVYEMERTGNLEILPTGKVTTFKNKLFSVTKHQLQGKDPERTTTAQPTTTAGSGQTNTQTATATSSEPAWDKADGDWEIQTSDGQLNTKEITVGEQIRASAKLKNTGDEPLKIRPRLQIEGETVKRKTVVVPAQSSKRVTFTYEFSEPGVYKIKIGPVFAGVVTVNAETRRETSSDEKAVEKKQETTITKGFGEVEAPTPGFSSLAALSALLITLLFLARR